MKAEIKSVAKNKKAFHDYFILEELEAGIELFGTEVKSLRAGTVNLKDSYVDIKNGEAFAIFSNSKYSGFISYVSKMSTIKSMSFLS